MRPHLHRARRGDESAAGGADALECGVVACDTAGRLVVVNRHARRLLGDDGGATGPDGPLQRALRGARDGPVRLEVDRERGTRLLEASAEAVTGADGAVIGAVMVLTDVTGRAEAARREFESVVVGNLAEAVVVVRARDGSILYANATTERVFGHRPDDLVGRHASCLSVTDREPPGRRAAEIVAAVAAGQVWSGDVEGRRSDGMHIWTTLRVSGFDHAVHGPVWICVHAEAAPRMAAEKAAREAETRFRAVFENVPVAMVLIGRDMRILEGNAAAAALTGLAPEELTGGSLADVTHPDDVGRDGGLAARLFGGEIREFSVEQRIATRAGRYAAMSITTTAVADGGRPACAMVTLQALRRPRVREARRVTTAPC
jgi:two-component system, chemotaxis family, CheB/CheR fusion protein